MKDLLFTNSTEPLSSSEWVVVAPYGEHPSSRHDLVQRLTKELATKLAAGFANEKAAAGGNWRGLPIYSGHPDFDPIVYQNKRRYGKIVGLRAGAKGLEIKAASAVAPAMLLDRGKPTSRISKNPGFMNPCLPNLPTAGQPPK